MPSAAPVATPSAERALYRADATAALRTLSVDPSRGLTSEEARARRERFGPNELEEAPRTPGWKRFLDQFKNLLILILLAAAVVSAFASQELKTPLVVLFVVLLNAIIGFVQESRAEASLEALRRMLVTQTRVRRDGEMLVLPARELVPGDIVSVEAGDRLPADGRLLSAVQLEVEEAALTGESVPTAKSVAPLDREAGIGDRHNMVFMNTTVTRGRGELVVTDTGMGTEIGRIAGMLRTTTGEKTPLQRQLDGLAHSLAKLAGIIVALVFIIGLLRGQSLADLFLTAVALAVASIPEGLPAVTAVTLAIGVSQMAKQHAIVKRLASVETLGCTSVICSDKTGTLTLNQMTAEQIVAQGRTHRITGEGYVPRGTIEPAADGSTFACRAALEAMVLCNDASLRQDEHGQWQLVGDPTEGALVVLGGKAGIEGRDLRERYPRLGEVPFDSAHKLMATIHEVPVGDGQGKVLRLFAKGAPDALLDRARDVLGPDGERTAADAARRELESYNRGLAEQGLRVLAVAQRDLTEEEWAQVQQAGAPSLSQVRDLTILALVGIVDPPRAEARLAIQEAQQAGIRVKMITGDHAATASTIGNELGLAGPGGSVVAVTGADLDTMDDEELAGRIDSFSVFARVAPEHKLRLVATLQRRREVVAMTGDGVNDAPALRQADMGVAMGIAGTEVTKEAATMVLTDDNFATIVRAVRQGRTIYDNIVKFVRFQLSTTLGFAAVFLGAAVLGIADGKPFTAIAILWVNIIMDGPPAMALGLDPGDADIMRRKPRPRSERILTRQRWSAIGVAATVMAAGTLGMLAWGPGAEPVDDTPTVAATMAFNTFVLFQFFNILNVRSDRCSVFHRQTFTNWRLWVALALVLALQFVATYLPAAQDLFNTTAISAEQWLLCVAVASAVLWTEELRKLVLRLVWPLRQAESPPVQTGHFDSRARGLS